MKNLTAYNECNEREINSMVGKAMCAYANFVAAKSDEAKLTERFGEIAYEKTEAALRSEYEATVRCIDMFVRESIYEIQDFVIAEAEKMMAA